MIDDGRVGVAVVLLAGLAIRGTLGSRGVARTHRPWPLEETGLIDRTGWPRGPWDAEPDVVRWIDAKTGLRCLVARASIGSLAGYVEVPKDHVWFGEQPSGTGVHGGLTWSGAQYPYGEGADGWWVGFDCGHSFDVTPSMMGSNMPGSEYRTIAYVKTECAKLAATIWAAA